MTTCASSAWPATACAVCRWTSAAAASGPATAANYPGDGAADRDVLLTSRTIGGSAAQAFLTQADTERTVSAVSIGCVGKKLLAVAWLEQSFGKSRAKLMLRSLEPLGETPAFRKVIGLGDADRKGGISVDASTDAVHVAWTAGADRDLLFTRFRSAG